MAIVYRVLGVVAAVCSHGSRRRVNGIPLHLLFPALLGILVFAIGTDSLTIYARRFGQPPVSRTVDTALEQATPGDYVLLRGSIAPDIEIAASGSSHATYHLLTDPATRRGILIEDADTENEATALTGVLYALPTDLASHLRPSGGQLGSYIASDKLLLRSGTTPSDPRLAACALGIVTAAYLLLAASLLRRHIIFQPEPPSVSVTGIPPVSATRTKIELPIVLRFSGSLTLPGKIVTRFLNVPAVLTASRDGKPTFASQIDASASQAYGGVLERAGVWLSLPKASTLGGLQSGRLYVGLAVLPALRLHYVDTALAAERYVTTVLAFPSPADRDRARTTIEHLVAVPAVDAVPPGSMQKEPQG